MLADPAHGLGRRLGGLVSSAAPPAPPRATAPAATGPRCASRARRSRRAAANERVRPTCHLSTSFAAASPAPAAVAASLASRAPAVPGAEEANVAALILREVGEDVLEVALPEALAHVGVGSVGLL